MKFLRNTLALLCMGGLVMVSTGCSDEDLKEIEKEANKNAADIIKKTMNDKDFQKVVNQAQKDGEKIAEKAMKDVENDPDFKKAMKDVENMDF